MKDLYSFIAEENATPGNTPGMGDPVAPDNDGDGKGSEPLTAKAKTEKPKKKKKHTGKKAGEEE